MYRIKFFILFFILPIVVFSQYDDKQIAFRELTVEQGLSQNSVISVAQDSTGYMWFATQDGLNKYDGKQFVHFPYQFEDVTRSTFSRLGKVYINKNDVVWIITNSGKLYKQVKETEEFTPINGLTNISTLIHSEKNGHFFGTFGSGLYRITEEAKDTVQILQPEHMHLVTYDLFQYKDLVLSATNNGVIEIYGNTYRYVELQKDTNFSAFASKKDTLFLGSYGNGLFYSIGNNLNFKPFTGFENSSLPEDLIIQDILVDSRGKLWIATYGDGAYMVDFSKKSVQHFIANKTNPYALHYNDVLCLYEDFTGIIWLGTDGSGLSYYDEDLVKFNVLTNKQAPDNINIDFVRAITKQNGKVWLGTSNKGLTAIDFELDSYNMYTTQNSTLNSDRIMSLFNSDEYLWVGHQNSGLQKLESNNKFKTFESTNGMSIWKIYQAQNKMLWLCTLNGLLLFDENQGIVKTYNSENSIISSNAIRTVEAGNKKQLWIGTESEGLFLLNTETETITEIPEIKDRIKSLYFNNNILWIGTNGNGLKSYNTKAKTIKHFTTIQGLANNVVYGILQGSEKNLWLSSNKGLTRITIDNDEILEIENFSNYDGLQTNEFNTGAYYKDETGILYFGGLEGLNWFKPDELSYNTIKPKTVITDVSIFNKPIDTTNNSVFKYKENTFTFTFSGLHYSQPDRNQYKYQLVNNDPDWISSGNNNVAHYTNLPPNDYTFKVISSNYDGAWGTIPATFSFTVLKPWYITNTAITLYIILSLLFAYVIYKYMKFRWEMKTQLRLEHAETERLKKLDEFKTNLYTNISHEIRTPLTLISGPVDKLLSIDNLSESDKGDLILVKQNATRLINLVNQMMDLSIVDSGKLKLKIEKGNLGVLLHQIIEAFKYKASENDLEIQAKIPEIDNTYFDSDIVEKVISNLLFNAIKYAPKGSEVYFDTKLQGSYVVISILNEYSKVVKQDLNKLFKRFYQDNEANEGIGVGLALVKELVTLSKGRIIANTIDDNKIQFTITMPIVREVYTDEEIVEEQSQEEEINSTFNKNEHEKPILIVEDNQEIRKFLVSIFNYSYNVIEADNGEKGIVATKKYLPDIIISDVMMPIKDGFELCEFVKSETYTSHIPVILLTARVGEENEIQGLKTGADAYISKPFSAKHLKAKVNQLFKNRLLLKERFSKEFAINPELGNTSTETKFLDSLQTILENHITNPEFNSEQLAKQIHLSRTQLHRKLKAIYGLTTSEFIRTQRLKLAQQLLKSSDSTVSEVAYQVGFNSPSYFIKSFKEVYKITPNSFQKSNK